MELKINSTLTVDHVYDEIPAQKIHNCVDVVSQGNFCVHFNKSTTAIYANESSDVIFNKNNK